MAVIGFIFFTLTSVFWYYMYKYSKKKEEEWPDSMLYFKGYFPLVILCIVGVILCFFIIIGVIDLPESPK